MVPSTRFVRSLSRERPPTVADFLHTLSAAARDQMRTEVLEAMKLFVPEFPASHDKFRNELFRLYGHLHQYLYGQTIDPHAQPLRTFEWLRAMYKSDFHAAERNALLGRDAGGIIGICQQIVENVIQSRISTMIDLIFFEFMPKDQESRLRLAEDFVQNHASRAFLDSREMRQPFMLASNIEEVIVEYAKSLDPVYKSGRW